jgi:hypothetical protein
LFWEFKVAESAWVYRHHLIFQSNEVKFGIASHRRKQSATLPMPMRIKKITQRLSSGIVFGKPHAAMNQIRLF